MSGFIIDPLTELEPCEVNTAKGTRLGLCYEVKGDAGKYVYAVLPTMPHDADNIAQMVQITQESIDHLDGKVLKKLEIVTPTYCRMINKLLLNITVGAHRGILLTDEAFRLMIRNFRHDLLDFDMKTDVDFRNRQYGGTTIGKFTRAVNYFTLNREKVSVYPVLPHGHEAVYGKYALNDRWELVKMGESL